MAKEPKVNYTDEMTADLIERYNGGNGESVADLAESFRKTNRSIISKLVREGVYVAAEKPAKAKREEGPTKKELLNDLESLVGFDVTGLMGATKEAISAIIALAKAESVEAGESDESAAA